ncbi:hypothetical protein ABZ054_25130, partial [Streptomyces sp. NPDC006324]
MTTGAVGKDSRTGLWLPVGLWGLTRVLLLVCVFKVVVIPGPDVTFDVENIYRGWYEVLRSGTYPLDDVTWQYPPAAAFVMFAPDLLPFLDYASAFFVLALLCDALVLGLLLYAVRSAKDAVASHSRSPT